MQDMHWDVVNTLGVSTMMYQDSMALLILEVLLQSNMPLYESFAHSLVTLRALIPAKKAPFSAVFLK